MDKGAAFRRTAAAVNKAVVPLMRTGPGRKLLGGSFAEITYRGRKSGREFTLPVNYRRDKTNGDVLIMVAAPSAKTWWRNFTGAGADLKITLGGVTHDAHAVATQNAKGGVSLRVKLGD